MEFSSFLHIGLAHFLSLLLDILYLFLFLDKWFFSSLHRILHLVCIRKAIDFCIFWKNYDKRHEGEEKERCGGKNQETAVEARGGCILKSRISTLSNDVKVKWEGMGPIPGVGWDSDAVNMRVVRDHAGKKDMPLFLVFYVPLIAFIRESSTCDRKIQKLGCLCGVCVCVCARMQLDKEHRCQSQNLWAHMGTDYQWFHL